MTQKENKKIQIYSKRNFFKKLLFLFISNPIKFLSKITPKRLGLFFHVLNTEGTPEASRRLNKHLADDKLPEYSQEIKLISKKENLSNTDNYEIIEFKKEVTPIVSIIIPVYNQFNYTYNCLKSIKENSGDLVNYEIIVANDCSTDLTTNIQNIIKNINVITTTENVKFLKNCNNAAKHAKGKYILFLNNDTQVQENWLAPLIELIEKDEKNGAVGSKLVYENGMLQEAGSILWNDASVLNYGRLGDPGLPEFNYAREADYISGAAMMIKKSIWDKLNGFNEEFIPAYFEDADICFSIRKMGYKVMYQPASVVVHFEGISNGKNVTEGIKQYQIINQKKFFVKWQTVLNKENFPNGENVFLARDRTRDKKTILFIDRYVPMYDKDAGSRTVFQYLILFVNLGFNIKFIADNYYKYEPYTTILEQMGIEVLYGPFYAKNWKMWLDTNGKYINYVFLNRPHISIKYIDEIKKRTKAKVFFYGHDLHFLREKREYEIKKDKKLLKSVKEWEKIEIELIKKADISYYPSEIEVNEIKKQYSSINVKTIPAYLFDQQSKKEKDFENTADLMFIGGFQHKPNIDGILWYIKEIFPILNKKRPDIKTYILGSSTPEEILDIKQENIVICGYVSDEQLDEFYTKCRLSIVPLRYGAGVKGKVVEAMYNQMPVITTSMGAEGIKSAEQCMFIKDDPVEFAEEIIRIYDDYQELEEKSSKSYQYICENFSEKAAISVLKEDGLI